MRSLAPTLALLCGLPLALSAEESSTPDADATVVVTATRGEADAWRVPASTVALDQEEIVLRGAPVHALDLLAQEPGIQVLHNGSPGGVSSVRIRGARSESTSFLIDGVPVADPVGIGGQLNASFLNPAGVTGLEEIGRAHV